MANYNFQYVPTSGDISGKSFEDQTEAGFNEIGELTDEAKDQSQQALETSQLAVDTANTAVDIADGAVDVSNNALVRADEAYDLATTVTTAADNAQSRADEAYDLATTATTAADNAQSRADGAHDLAESAITTADNAQSRADGAYDLAESAANVANQAIGVYTVDATAVDANDEIFSPTRLFLTESGIKNFPITTPLYFSVSVDSDSVSATQYVWSATEAGTIYTRLASISYSTGPPPEVLSTTFSDWKTLGGSGTGTIVGKIDLLPFRASELPKGWYLCNGDRFSLLTPQGEALNSLSTNFKEDWGIAVVDDTINLPSMFHADGRGYFLRAVAGVTRQIGTVEEDAFQGHEHIGRYSAVQPDSGGAGPYGTAHYSATTATVDKAGFGTVRYSTETRSLNIGMTPAINLGV